MFARKDEAQSYLSGCSYPVVLKANVGGAASQVRVVPSAWRAKWIARRVFGLIHPGRFRRQNGEFVFEEGLFNRHGSYLLRVEHFVALLSGRPVPG